MALCAAPAGAASSQQSHMLSLAESGVAQAASHFGDSSQGLWNGQRNVRIRWYDEIYGPRPRYPLATIWGSVPLFEALIAIATADPTTANRGALETFAEGPAPKAAGPVGRAARTHKGRHHAARHKRKGKGKQVLMGAEAYWDATVGGYAPYPGDRGRPNVWCDDNAWWGLAFEGAYRVLGGARLLQDAQNAIGFMAETCWDPAGGFWWNTAHIPDNQHSGEPLAGGALLAALLSQDQAKAGNSVKAATDLQKARAWLAWGDAHFAGPGGLYWRTQDDPTPTPYIAGPTVEAKEILCQSQPSGNPFCAQASALANAADSRFADRLNMGPQFDTIYLHWMLVYAQQTGDRRWVARAVRMANMAQSNAAGPVSGLYERAWDGTDMSGHQAGENMLRTHAATVELFGWLAVLGP